MKNEFIRKAKEIHGDRYDYSKVEYVNSKTKVCIICPIHGEFWQTPHSHLRGRGCRACGLIERSKQRRKTKDEFIRKAKEIHGDKYDYSKVEYNGTNQKVCIICPNHGEFWQTPHSHLNGSGCLECYREKQKEDRKYTQDEFIEKAKEKYGNTYDYSKVNYVDSKTKVCIICPNHGEFWITPAHFLNGRGCKECGVERSSSKQKMPKDKFIYLANNLHNNSYDYSKVNYVDSKTKVCIICPKHGEFYQTPNSHLRGCGCPKCISRISLWENEVGKYIESLQFNIERSNRTILNGKEIDIFIPEKNIGIECDGLIWHSELYCDKNEMLEKTINCEKKGITLIHIFEDEWTFKKDIVKSRLKSLLNKNTNRIYARKCNIKLVDSKEKKKFLDENHMQGNAQSSINIGLYYDDELISLMTFGKPRINLGGKNEDGKYELVRFCNLKDTSVIGGASKLLKYFIKEYSPKEIVSYADKRWSVGNLYTKLGFIHTHDSKPNYFYIVDRMCENRFKYRKDKLVKEGFDKDKSEREIMLERKIYRIYDCGTMVFKMNFNVND